MGWPWNQHNKRVSEDVVLGLSATGLTHLRQPCLECGWTAGPKINYSGNGSGKCTLKLECRVASLETPLWPRVQWLEPRNDFGITGRPTNRAPPNAGGDLDLDHSDWTGGIPNLDSPRQRRQGNSGLFEMREHLNCYLSNAMKFQSHSFAVANVKHLTLP